MHRPLPLVFLAATVDAQQLPPSKGEVVFLGRSNVGKSSLLNALANQKDLARVSNTPGRTQVLACFGFEIWIGRLTSYAFRSPAARVTGQPSAVGRPSDEHTDRILKFRCHHNHP